MQATYMDAVSYCDHRPTAPLNHTIIFSITRLCSPTDGRTTVCEKLPYKYFCRHITNSLLCIGEFCRNSAKLYRFQKLRGNDYSGF